MAAILLGTVVPASAAPLTPGWNLPPAATLGLLPDTLQQLGRIPAHARMAPQALPPRIDLTPNLPPIGNQGQEGSCVAWSAAYYYASYQAGLEQHWDLKDAAHQFSPAFVYNQINGGQDGGSYPSDAFNLMQTKGVASLATMPYRAGDYKTQPSANQRQDALPYTVSSWAYFKSGDVAGMKAHLAGGDLVSLSVPVYENFMWPKDPCNTPIGAPAGRMLGGHQITLVGYDDTKQAFRFANSWGTGWGCSGFAWLSYDFVAKSAWNGYDMLNKTDTLGILSGQVTDASTHAAISGAQITVGGYTIASDAAGNYALAVPAGSQTVSVAATGHTTWTQATPVSAGIAGTVNPVLQVQGRGTLSGTVTDEKSHAAIVGAKITVGTLSTTSGASGAYTLAVPVGVQLVKVTAAGYTDWTQSAQVNTGATSTLSPSLVQAVGTVTGKVTDIATHAAIVGARVTVGSVSKLTNAAGVYTLVVPAGFPSVTVTMSGYANWVQQAIQISTGATVTANPVLTRAQGTLTGKVIDSSTKAPIVGARISVGSLSATTSAAGTYSLVVPSGPATITFSASGYASATSYVNVQPGFTITSLPALSRAH